MELVVNTFETEPLPESLKPFDFSHLNDQLLNSNYKAATKENFITSSKSSVFKMRQRLKYKQFNSVNAAAIVLKLSVFVFTLTMLF